MHLFANKLRSVIPASSPEFSNKLHLFLLHLRAFKMRVVTLPLPYVPTETPTLVGVLNRQRCKNAPFNYIHYYLISII